MIPQDLREKIRHIEIKSGRVVNSFFSGEYHSVFKGRGMEFSEVREYTPGDDIREIDWNVTARTGHAHIKRFVEERELTLMLMVDCSGSGIFGTGERTKQESAIMASAMIAFSALKNKDRVGLLIFTDKVELYIPPRKGRTHVLRIIRELLSFKPEGKGTNIKGALEYILKIEKKRAILFLVSDFQSSEFKKPLVAASKKHDLIAVHIFDSRERELPPVGYIDFEDPETGEFVTINSSDKKFIKKLNEVIKREELEREKLFRSYSIDTISIDTKKPVADALVNFFKMRIKRFR